ncbi:hypothetical protein [Streptomyces sp. CB01201]|uniref:hypothetical protein n=1 Tax=Streptomyces sp. CB01201 TaxID=2020324 RepID=UPI00131E2FCD|nr:hypothetical protein [Streptomyces sp. CB01201]
MTLGVSGTKFCIYCDRPIVGVAVPASQAGAWASASGARPDNWKHLNGDPACRTPRR